MLHFLYPLASPKSFYAYTQRWIPRLRWATIVLFVGALIEGLVLAPPDYQQGDAFRMIYVHVPAAFLSLAIYGFATFCAFLVLVWRIKLAEIMLKVSISQGSLMTLIALITGSLWGKPMWGTWWVWDARLTSELILLFIYLGIAALLRALPNPATAARVGSIMTLVGFVDLPVIHYSVYWWNTLHQGASLAQIAKPSIAPGMLWPLLLSIAAFFTYFILSLLSHAQTEVLMREKNTEWVKNLLSSLK